MNIISKYLRNKQTILLLIYDLTIACFSYFFMVVLYQHIYNHHISLLELWITLLIYILVLIVFRFIGKIYRQIWRYGGVQSYLTFICFDYIALIVFYILDRILPISDLNLGVIISLFSINLTLALSMRILYRYCYKYGNNHTFIGQVLNLLMKIASFNRVKPINVDNAKKIPVAILGAGENGINLASELLANKNSLYVPRLFLDNDKNKIDKEISGIKVLSEFCDLKQFTQREIQEVIFAAHTIPFEKKKELYQLYRGYGLNIKSYTSPSLDNPEKRVLKDFDVEELLFRKQQAVLDKDTINYYKNKSVLVTGGGGSIGSQIARELAKMSTKQIILLDIYENGAYDVLNELTQQYKNKIDVQIEICSITNKVALDKVLKKYKPNIVIMAAAHKHVPLMEKNVVEAIYNNVFGTLNTVELSIKNKVDRVIMVSTDKAVNPTNVMGATKRVCEMIVSTYSKLKSHTTFSMTRFGNVLGSAGSVIPLFKRQIAMGGPITITDNRITRYFMSIPEASQLVLKSGAMAKNGELFVLDMSDPVRIIDLAQMLIKLSGLEPYKDIDIKQIGLRPGEKLYEELLIDTTNLKKTKDKLIFIDTDTILSKKQLDSNLKLLLDVVKSNNDDKAKDVLAKVVPTYTKR